MIYMAQLLNSSCFSETALFTFSGNSHSRSYFSWRRGEEQNREEGEMAQTKLGGGRNRGEK